MDSTLHQHLFSACENGDLETVQLLVSSGIPLDIRNQNGFTPLALAIHHLDVVRYLLSAGAHPNDTDNTGNTPLHHAVWNENKEVIACMLDHGADPTIENRYGATCVGVKKYNFQSREFEENGEISNYIYEYTTGGEIKDPGCE